MKKIIIVITVLLLPFLIGGSIVFNPPTYELQGSESELIQREKSYGYRIEPLSITDTSRSTPAMGDFEGVDHREFVGKIWMPDVAGEDSTLNFPLVIYSHGFMSFHEESDYLGAFLAQKGYIMAAFDYPASSFDAPGGPNLNDIANQPGDISFVLDYLFARNDDPNDRLYHRIDVDKVAAVGLSFGGLTTTLAAYHKELRDNRIGAAISIAGPVSFFTKSYFETSEVPFMYVAGNIDAMVNYNTNVQTLKDKMSDATIVTIANGSHTGFADISEKIFRWVNNPDDVGCAFLLNNIPKNDDNPFAILGGKEVGIDFDNFNKMPCQNMPLPAAIAPGKQLVLTKMAVYSFLQSQFAESKEALMHKEFLTVTLAKENDAIEVVE